MFYESLKSSSDIPLSSIHLTQKLQILTLKHSKQEGNLIYSTLRGKIGVLFQSYCFHGHWVYNKKLFPAIRTCLDICRLGLEIYNNLVKKYKLQIHNNGSVYVVFTQTCFINKILVFNNMKQVIKVEKNSFLPTLPPQDRRQR